MPNEYDFVEHFWLNGIIFMRSLINSELRIIKKFILKLYDIL
jgi:hypothetical protein